MNPVWPDTSYVSIICVMGDDLDIDWREPIPIFPLPNCVLLPGGVLPLHVFEPRYRRMMQNIVDRDPADRMIAVALLRDGYEPLYHTNHAPVHPVVCVGQVAQHEELADGRFNLILVGYRRAMIRLDDQTESYRSAVLKPVCSTGATACEDALSLRLELRQWLDQAARKDVIAPDVVEQLFAAHETIDSLVDVLAFYFIPSDAFVVKQRILEEGDVQTRHRIVCSWLQRLTRCRPRATAEEEERPWPPPHPTN